MATVVRALGPPRPDRPPVVALKFLHRALYDDATALSAFHAEGRLGLELDHPNLVRTYGMEISRGQTALVLEWVDGNSFHTLHGHLLSSPWALEDQYVVARLVAQLCRGL